MKPQLYESSEDIEGGEAEAVVPIRYGLDGEISNIGLPEKGEAVNNAYRESAIAETDLHRAICMAIDDHRSRESSSDKLLAETIVAAVSGREKTDATESAEDFFKKVWFVVHAFRGNRAFAFDCACLSLGWSDIVGVSTQEELAARYGQTKANVNKLIKQLQALVKMPAMIGQRDEKSCEAMATSRNDQLK